MNFQYDDIVQDTNTSIRQKSAKVTFPLQEEDKELLLGLLAYVKDSQDEELAQTQHLRPAVGIAAIQVGVPKCLLAVVVPGEEDESISYALVNPRIVSESLQRSYLKNGEGCLSVENVHEGLVPRSARITVKGYDLIQEKDITIKANDYLSIVLQHEIDHFNGILFYDRINADDPWKEEPNSIIIE